MTGYFLFMNTVRQGIKDEHPEYKVTQISKAVGAKWNSLDGDKKQEFLGQANKLKEAYKKKYAVYLKSDEKRDYDEAKKAWQKEQKAKEKRAKQRAKAKAQQDEYEDDDDEDDEEDEYEMVSE